MLETRPKFQSIFHLITALKRNITDKLCFFPPFQIMSIIKKKTRESDNIYETYFRSLI